ncbi:GH92 family glycosyl hydrolase [Lentzea sp. JNUCC 0626]|uniref:GH92 family glycosyl hydrolase n=1 Tax=Lentzea sp. JNUCC 0626 TaxID=3367513 RepID=UPI003749ED51
MGTTAAAVVAGAVAATPVHAAAPEAVDEIDPMIGALTTGADTACGKTFPGPVTPFGLVQLGPDTVSGGDNGSGYSADMTTIEGFSFTHMGGVGCYGDLGNLQVMPQTGPLVTGRDAAKSPFTKSSEVARAGYYAVTLDRYRVRAELTAAARAGILRFTFQDAGTGRIKVDLSRRVGYDGTHSVAQHMKQVDAHTIEGWMRCDRLGGGWICGNGPYYTVYFSLQFQQPIRTLGVWEGNRVDHDVREWTTVATSSGFFVELPVRAGQQVLVKSGISYTSVDGARANRERDISGWDFDGTAKAARKKWADAIGKVSVTGGTADQRKIFNTALYHTMIDPRVVSDVDSGDKYGRRTIFSGWDVFRSEFPLLTIIDDRVVSDQINTLMELTRTGAVRGLAKWELLGIDTGTMLGDPAVNVIAEAVAKGIKGFDAEAAYRMCRDVALGPAERSNRNDFANWHRLGYAVETSLSNTVENAYSDFALARMAEKLGHRDDAVKLHATAKNYRNVFNHDVGWFRGRNADGSWMDANSGCIESNPEQQGWFVPHDVPGLIELAGGQQKFVDRLNGIFERTPPEQMMKWNENYNHSNEPVHQMPFMFTYAGAPWLTQKWSRYVCDNAYRTGPAGLAGNDDCGQMSAWYVFAAAGFYPVSPVSGVYVLGSPIFATTTFRTSRNRDFTIKREGDGIYVQSAQLNGRGLNRAWITHEEVMSGGTLTMRMGAEPNKAWGSDPKNAPPA